MKSDNNGRTTDGKFALGNPGKPSGSSKNKMRDKIRSFIDNSWEDFPKWFKELSNKEKIQTLIDLMPYAVSRLQSVASTDSEGNDLPEKRPFVDYTKLSERTLKEILNHTHGNDTEN